MNCGVCGAPARAATPPPPPEQAPDLDFRPGEPTRSSLPHWVATCRRCGAAAPDLSRLTATAPVGSAAYRSLRDEPPGTLRFRRWALLCAPGERHEALLWAAWMADDAGDEAAARELRRAALAVWPDDTDARSDPAREAARRIDVLRRAGSWQEAAAACATAPGDPAVLAYQRARIEAGDGARHLLSSALRPPARTPHAAHGPARPRSLWSRWLGR